MQQKFNRPEYFFACLKISSCIARLMFSIQNYALHSHTNPYFLGNIKPIDHFQEHEVLVFSDRSDQLNFAFDFLVFGFCANEFIIDIQIAHQVYFLEGLFMIEEIHLFLNIYLNAIPYKAMIIHSIFLFSYVGS